MYRARHCTIFVTAVFLLAKVPTLYGAEENAIRDRFVGVWRLESWETRQNDSTTTLPFDGKAEGRIIYTADGYMSAQLMEAGRPPCAAPSIFSCTESQLKAAASGYLGYTGRFSVQEDRRTVTHHVVVAFNPGRVGTKQVRQFEFLSANRLQLSAAINNAVTVLIWERVGYD